MEHKQNPSPLSINRFSIKRKVKRMTHDNAKIYLSICYRCPNSGSTNDLGSSYAP
jgi:hypothetical protein